MSAPAAQAESDEQLVLRFRAGDERAFTLLYRRHARYIAGVARRLMGDELELDEVVQGAFLALRDGAGSIQDPARVRGSAPLMTSAPRPGAVSIPASTGLPM